MISFTFYIKALQNLQKNLQKKKKKPPLSYEFIITLVPRNENLKLKY